MIDAVETLKAQEMLELAQMIAISVAAALAMAGAAGSRKAGETVMGRYNQYISGKQAVIQGTVGFEVDEHGQPLLRSAGDIRRWFMDKGQVRV